jgi:hypothetical protein
VVALIEVVAPQLRGVDAEDAVLELERLVAETTRVRDLKTQKESTISGLQRKIAVGRESSREAREVISRLLQAAAVTSMVDLRAAIGRSDEMRTVQAELDRVTNALTQDGDGLSIAQLTSECEATDIDAIAAKEQFVTLEVEDLRDRLMEAREGLAFISAPVNQRQSQRPRRPLRSPLRDCPCCRSASASQRRLCHLCTRQSHVSGLCGGAGFGTGCHLLSSNERYSVRMDLRPASYKLQSRRSTSSNPIHPKWG